jgi:hypothetical protein
MIPNLTLSYVQAVMNSILPQNKKEFCAFILTTAMTTVSVRAALAVGTFYIGLKLTTTKKLPDPASVREIYALPQWNEPSSKRLADKIDRLKNDSTILGLTCVPTRDSNQLRQIYIKGPISLRASLFCDSESVRFTAHDLKDDRTIGTAYVRPFHNSTVMFTEEELEWFSHLIGYGLDPTDNKPKILLSNIKNDCPQKYKNVGVVLTKAILQYYKEPYNGRTFLEAVRNSQPYWYKLGFRVSKLSDQHLNASFAQMAQSNTVANQDNGSHYMHLPKEGIDLWLKEIEKNPIRFPSLK